jgi:hypothetical protein
VVLDLGQHADELFQRPDPLAERDRRGGIQWREPKTMQDFADFWLAIANPAARVTWKGLGNLAQISLIYEFYDPVNVDEVERENAKPIFNFEYPNYRQVNHPVNIAPLTGMVTAEVVSLCCLWPAALEIWRTHSIGDAYQATHGDRQSESSPNGAMRYPTLIHIYEQEDSNSTSNMLELLLQNNELNTDMHKLLGEHVYKCYIEISSCVEIANVDLQDIVNATLQQTLKKGTFAMAYLKLATLPKRLRTRSTSDVIAALERQSIEPDN